MKILWRMPTSNSAWTTKEKTEGTSLSTAKATPTTRDRGIGDWKRRHYDRQVIVISHSGVFVILKENFNFLTQTCTFPFSKACRCNIVLFSSISTPNDSNESSFPLFLLRMTRMVLHADNIKPGKSQRPDTSPGGRSLLLYMNHIAICCP